MAEQRHHIYQTKDGTEVPSVTEVIKNLGWSKDALIGWARREAMEGRDPLRAKDRSSERGTVAHARIAAYLHGKRFKKDKEYSSEVLEETWAMRETFVRWWKRSGGKVLLCEEPLVHEELGYGGTIDLVADIGGPTLLDIKTSASIWPEHHIQVAAYEKILVASQSPLLGKHVGNGVEKIGIVHLPRAGELTIHIIPRGEIEAAWKVFEHLLAIEKLRPFVAAGG